jgi:hypothetical protein
MRTMVNAEVAGILLGCSPTIDVDKPSCDGSGERADGVKRHEAHFTRKKSCSALATVSLDLA